jgi:hypothetical protein
MAVVRKASSSNRVVSKRDVAAKQLAPVRSPSRIAEQGDVNFGTLDATKDGLLVSYDSATDKFILITADELLSSAGSDQDLPDDFIDILEDELELANVAIDNLDGGSF